MFERFNDRSRRVLVLAQEEARLLNHSFIGTEHIVLGLVHEGEGIGARTLKSFGISLEAVREKVEDTIGMAGTAPVGSPPFTPRAKKVLELALREALQLGQDDIGTEHLLLGVVREGEGVGAQVLVSLGADLGRVRQRVIELMSAERGRGPGPPADEPGARAPRAGHEGVAREAPPSRRCALCGRSLWETARVVVGAGGRICEECARAAAGMLERARPEDRELALPPRVSGPRPDDHAVATIVAALQDAFGPGAGPSTWPTAVEDPQRFEPLLRRWQERRGRPEAIAVAEIGFVNRQLGFFRVHLRFDAGRGTDVSGQVRRSDDRWLVTAETMAAVLAQAGIAVPPRSADG